MTTTDQSPERMEGHGLTVTAADATGQAPADEPMLTVAEVAARLRVRERTVRRYIAKGLLDAIRTGSLFRIPESSYRAYLRNNEVPAPATEPAV